MSEKLRADKPRPWSGQWVLGRLRHAYCSLPATARPGPNYIADLLSEYKIRALRLGGLWPLPAAQLRAVTRPCCPEADPFIVVEGP
jgi:hypothetical protein